MSLEDMILRPTVLHSKKIKNFCAPLKQHFHVNYFWYYKITNEGNYSLLGSHIKWLEYSFALNQYLSNPYFRHPSTLQSGISLIEDVDDKHVHHMSAIAKKKFNIHFNINILNKIPEGVEAFGFASSLPSKVINGLLFNELPSLTLFFKQFRKEHQYMFDQLEDYQVNLSNQPGSTFFEKSTCLVNRLVEKEPFHAKIGLEKFKPLSSQEKIVFKQFLEGYCPREIGEHLSISKRTVEDYIENIKNKFHCLSKKELIQKSLEFNLYYQL